MCKTICTICGGSGEQQIIVDHPLIQGMKKMCTIWCRCRTSTYISSLSKFKLLSWLGDDFLPYEEVNPELLNWVNDGSNRSLILKGSFDNVCLNLKSVIMMQEFKNKSIYFNRAIDLLQSYYVQQADGTSPGLGTLDIFDLLVFTMDTEEKNVQLKTVVAQVVYNRNLLKKPTWIWIPKDSLQECVQEYSPQLVEYLSAYKVVELGKSNVDHKGVVAQTRNIAAGLKL